MEIPARTRAQLEVLTLDPARPLIAVDADEVLVYLAAHLAQFIAPLGYEMRLTQYRLEGAIYRKGTERAVPFDACIALIRDFFASETRRQRPIPGGAEALRRLSRHAQIVILTNVPAEAREARVENLRALGIDYPLIENTGGKGPALAWMAKRVAGPVAFVDDSPQQIASARKALPEARLGHFVGADYVARLVREVPEADARAETWAEAEAFLAVASAR